MLHTLSRSPWQCDIAALLRNLQPGDDLLLLQDGVTAALANSRFLALLLDAPIAVSALDVDIDARGLSAYISPNISRVGYTDFVNLTVKHRSQFAW